MWQLRKASIRKVMPARSCRGWADGRGHMPRLRWTTADFRDAPLQEAACRLPLEKVRRQLRAQGEQPALLPRRRLPHRRCAGAQGLRSRSSSRKAFSLPRAHPGPALLESAEACARSKQEAQLHGGLLTAPQGQHRRGLRRSPPPAPGSGRQTCWARCRKQGPTPREEAQAPCVERGRKVSSSRPGTPCTSHCERRPGPQGARQTFAKPTKPWRALGAN